MKISDIITVTSSRMFGMTVHEGPSLWCTYSNGHACSIKFPFCLRTVADPGKKGGSSVKREKFGVTLTSGAVRLGKIPFSARGSPILELLRTVN